MGTVRAVTFLLLCLTVSLSFFVPLNHAAIPITGPLVLGMESYDRIIPTFMAKYNVPGGAVAVVKDGRLVFAHGYGYADATAGSPVQPYSLFRIASLSKQITAVTILKLVEEGRLTLDDKAFSILNIKPPNGMQVQDQRILNATIRELLEHSGGWNSDKTFDPMFEPFRIATFLGVTSPPSQDQIMQYMLTQPLQFDPGTQYAYSNFGYLMLGRVIEKVVAQPYEDYVGAHVLTRMGITDMKIGHTLLPFAAPNEVHYYDYPGAQLAQPVFPNMTASVPWPYGGFYLEDMDSHGGWIASAVDIVRFAASIDGARAPAFLGAAMVQQMSGRPPAPLWVGSDYWYGLGWLVREPEPGQFTWWHTGSLPGTMTIVVRAYDGLIWAALFNTRPSNSDQAFAELDAILWDARNAVTSWPTNDLFGQPIPEFSGRLPATVVLVLLTMVTMVATQRKRIKRQKADMER
jgi:CubicO group peptidase (beta-lactamase class C family)